MTERKRNNKGRYEGKKCIVENIKYKSLKDACIHYKVDYKIVALRIKSLNWTLEEALEIVNRNQIVVEGKTFKSIKQAADYYAMSHNTIKRRLDKNWSINEAFDLVKRKENSSACKGIIYKVKNKINSKVYIGLTTQKLIVRFNRHKYDAVKGSNTKLHRAMRKYGIENFKIRIIKETTNRYKLRKLEIKYIKKYNSILKGYNSMVGNGSTGDKHGKPIQYDGVKFISITALSEYVGISKSLVSYRLKNKIPLNKPVHSQEYAWTA
jgi:hypothetical protein